MPQIITDEDLKDKQNKQQNSVFQPQQRGSGFTNTQKLLQANRANQLGQRVAQNIQQQIGQTGQNLQQRFEQFRGQQEQQRQQLADYLQQRQNILSKFDVGVKNVKDVTEDEVKQFEKFRNLQYTGQRDLRDSEDFRTQAQDLQRIGQSIQTGAGRAALLQRFATGGKRYGLGEQTLDNLLLAQENQQDLMSAIREAQRQADLIQRTTQAAELASESLAKKYGAFGQDTEQAIRAQRGELTTDLDRRVKEAEEQRTKRLEEILSTIRGGGNLYLSREELKDLDIKPDIDLFSRYADEGVIRKSALDATRTNVASLDDYIKFQALSRLLGGVESEFTDRQQAGKFFEDQFDFNKELAQRIREEEVTKAIQNVWDSIAKFLIESKNIATRDYDIQDAKKIYDDLEVSKLEKRREEHIRRQMEGERETQRRLSQLGYRGIDLWDVYPQDIFPVHAHGAFHHRYAGEGSGINDPRLRSRFKTIRRILQSPQNNLTS